ncbi:MAG: choice-of-anchor J domain-containing protein, partial [Bacteroidetes bacterium]|nr:choice-of-anchor J domain-containing protein [Bacteroidota bacterium]
MKHLLTIFSFFLLISLTQAQYPVKKHSAEKGAAPERVSVSVKQAYNQSAGKSVKKQEQTSSGTLAVPSRNDPAKGDYVKTADKNKHKDTSCKTKVVLSGNDLKKGSSAKETAGKYVKADVKSEKKNAEKGLPLFKMTDGIFKQLTGAIVCNSSYVPGTTMDLSFTLTLTNTDWEYGDSVALTFPAGITPNGSPNNPFFVGSDCADDEALNGVAGQVISWGDNDNTCGGIDATGTYNFTVNVTIGAAVSGDQSVDWFVSGDEFADFGPPGNMGGTLIISEQLADDAGVIGFLEPAVLATCSFTSAENVTVAIRNFGGNPISNFNVSYTINGGAPVTESVTTIIPADDTLFYTFTATADLSAPGTYDFASYTELTGDGNLDNDTAYISYTQVAPSNIPYTMGFESGENLEAWAVLDENSDGTTWALYNDVTYAHTGTYAAGYPYNSTNSGDDWLITKCLNLQTGITYNLNFWYRARSATYPEKLAVYYGDAQDATSLTNLIVDVGEFTTTTYALSSSTFTVPVSGVYYIGFYAYSDADQWLLYIDDISISVCPPPSALNASNITTSSADLTWTTGGASAWNLEWDTAGFTPGTGAMVMDVISPYTLSGLTADTQYDFYVQDSCGIGNTSTWTGPYTFSTLCDAVAAFPWTEGFENGGAIPDCWSQEFRIGTHSWVYQNGGASSNPAAAHTGSYNAAFTHATTGTATKLITPPLDLSGLTIPELTFWYALREWLGDQDTLRVYYKNTPAGAWTLIPGAEYYADADWTEATFVLPNPSATYMIGFEGIDSYGYGVCLDDILVREQPLCTDPSTPDASALDHTSAELSWTENGTAATWNIEYGITGFTQGTGTPVNGVTSNPYILSGLAANTTYDFYVQADCGGDGTSLWIGPASFTTFCDAVAAFPWTEGFENGGAIPDCWTQEYGTGIHDWIYQNGGDDSNPATAHTGSFNAAFVHASTGTATLLITPPLDLTSLTTPELKFWYAMVEWLGDQDTLRVYYKNTFAGVWTLIPGAEYYADADWTEATFVLPNPSATYMIGFEGIDDYGYGVCLDDILIREQPPCINPSDLDAYILNQTSAELSWTENGPATQWNIEYGATGFVQGTGTLLSGITANPYTLSGLTAGTVYDFYVQADCGLDGTSEWIGPYTFTTFCDPITTYPWTEGFEGTWLPSLCWNNLDEDDDGHFWLSDAAFAYTGAVGAGSESYDDLTSSALSPDNWLILPPFTINDPNLKLQFYIAPYLDPLYIDEHFSVMVSTTGIDPADFTEIYSETLSAEGWKAITLPLSAYDGNDIFIAFRHWDCSDVWKLRLDDITIATCLPPYDLNALNETTTSSDLEWTTGGAGNWNIEWGLQGFIQGTGTLITGVTNPYTLTGLEEGTFYDFYVQDDCGGTDVSAWAGPCTFMTACNIISAFPWTEGFEEATFPPNGCWKNYDEDADTYIWIQDAAFAHDGNYGAGSASWESAALTPDNWLVTPQFEINDASLELSFWVSAYDDFYPAEEYSVLVSTASNLPGDFVEIYNEVLT